MSAPQTVALHSPGWPPGHVPNGIVGYTGQMRRALAARGLRVIVITDELAAPCDDRDLVVIPDLGLTFPRRVRRFVRHRLSRRPQLPSADGIVSAVRRAINRYGIELLEMEESWGRAADVTKRCDVPVVVKLHGPWFLTGAALGADRAPEWQARVDKEGVAIEQAAAVTAPTRDLIHRVAAHYGTDLSDAQVMPHPFDSNVAPPPFAKRRHKEILFVGRFDRLKGGDTLIDAFAPLGARHRDAELVFVGPDPGLLQEGGSTVQLPEFVERRVGDPSVRARIRWLGQQTASTIRKLRERAGVTVICSRYENFPLAALEAMASGSPIVATRVGGLAEMLQHRENGLLCEAEDFGALADCIDELLDDVDLAERLGARAALDCRNRYDPARIAKQSESFYRRILGST